MGQKYLKISLAVLLLVVFSSCKHNNHAIDVSGIKEEVKIKRFEQELFTIDTLKWESGITALRKKYPEMYETYVQFAWPIGSADSNKTATKLRLFISDRYWQELYRNVQQLYTKEAIGDLEKHIGDAFKHIKYYFPKDTLPQVYTIVKGFHPYNVTPTIFTYKNILGISLEMFMGADYKFYQGWPIYGEYQIKRFRKEYILPQVLKTEFSREFDEDQLTDKTILSSMIYKGKMLYFLEMMAPELADSLKIEYSSSQLKWCKANEAEIWGYFSGKDVLFKTGGNERQKFLQDGPFTNADGVPQESAPRLGEWAGWQIVRKYMEQHPEITLKQLFNDNDYRKILKESRYKPKR